MQLGYHAMKYRIITVSHININCLNPAYRLFLFSVADDTAALQLLWATRRPRAIHIRPVADWQGGRQSGGSVGSTSSRQAVDILSQVDRSLVTYVMRQEGSYYVFISGC